MYRSLTGEDLRRGLGLPPDYRVEALVVHGCGQEYPAQMMTDALGARGYSTALKAPVASMPGLRAARIGAGTVWHARVYGGAAACEATHLACVLGARCAVVIGTCGGLAAGAEAGEQIVADSVWADESTTRAYREPAAGCVHPADPGLSLELFTALAQRAGRVHRGSTVTFQAQLAETREQVRSWSLHGYLGVEMEAASVLAPAAAFGVPAAAALVIADNLVAEQSMFEPGYRSGRARRRAALAECYDAVLAILRHRIGAGQDGAAACASPDSDW